MAKFPIISARQELGFTPTTAVRFRGDTRTGEGLVGQAIGQAVVAGISELQRRSARKEAIELKRQEMLDTRSSITAGSFMTTAINENIAFRNTNADTMTWAKDLQERLSRAESQIGALDMSDDTRLLVNTKSQAISEEALSRSLIAETDRDKEDTRAAIISDVVEQYTNGTAQDQQDAGKRFLEISSTLMDENEARATLKTAIMAGQKARGEKAVSNVHGAIEAASDVVTGGDFDLARELAKNPIIPEPQQTTLRNAIRSAETARNVQQMEQLEIQREINRDEISKLIRAGKPAGAAIEEGSLDEKEQFTWFERERLSIERRAKGGLIVTDLARKHELLDMAAAINWPERQVTAQDVKILAYEGRYGAAANLDDAAYDEVMDSIRKAEEDKIPFTQKYIETTIGELITGAPSSVLGLPLPTLRTREDAVRHATNAFGRFVSRIPGVMDTINAKFPPEKLKSMPEEPKEKQAFDFDGELIGSYNEDGSITLNQEGVRRLWEIAGRDMEKARQMAEENRYVIPILKE